MNTDVQPGVVSTQFAEPGVPIHGIDLLCRFSGTNPAERRTQLEELHGLVDDQQPVEVTFGVTCGGLRRLGVAAGILGLLPDVFIAGADTRAQRLGDLPTQDPHAATCSDPRLDLIVMITSACPEPVQTVRTQIENMGLEVLSSLPTFLHSDRREHFGFRDGISNPPLQGFVASGDPSIIGAGVKTTRLRSPGTGEWRPLAAGEILLGHPNESGVVAGSRVLQDLIRNGSFLVWRKIEQHVDRFQELAQAMTASADPDLNEINAEKAKLFGRNQDGTPLVATGSNNGFDYSDAATNDAVSLHAHIRRANPRVTPGFSDARTRKVPISQTIGNPERTYGAFHRIVRRSMLWQEPAIGDKPKRVGTIFRCYQADIVDQFEFIQRNWLNSGDPFREGRLAEPVAGMLTEAPREDETIIDPRSAEKNQIPCPMNPVSGSTVTFAQMTTPLATLYALVLGHEALRDLVANKFGGL